VPEVILAHDYLLQVGGAERVVAEWAAGFGARRVVTLAHAPASTFDEFRDLDVRATIPGAFANQVEWMLPALPSIAARTTVDGGDVALVSSSGWAHRFQFEIPHVVYVHSTGVAQLRELLIDVNLFMRQWNLREITHFYFAGCRGISRWEPA